MSQDVSMGVSRMESRGYSRDITMQTVSESIRSRGKPPRRAKGRIVRPFIMLPAMMIDSALP